MKAVVYCRVSTQEQVGNLSLSTQQEACRDFCAREGYEISRVFVEEGESAKNANRTRLKEMISYCERHRQEIDVVVVYALNRFARKASDHHALRFTLQKMAITLRSVTEPIDESASGKLMESVIAGFAEFDNTTRGERAKTGMIASAKSGKWTFPAPLGYLNSRGSLGSASLLADPDRAPLIHRAFELLATGSPGR